MGIISNAIDYYKRHKTEGFILLLVFLLCIALIIGVLLKIAVVMTVAAVLLGLLAIVSIFFSIQSYFHFDKVIVEMRREHLSEIINNKDGDVVATPSFTEEESKFIKRQKRAKLWLIIFQIALVLLAVVVVSLNMV